MGRAERYIPGLGALIALSPHLFAGSLAVTVKGPAGRPVADAAVELSTASRTAIHTLSTGNDGRATFDPLPAGEYRVAVTKPGFALAEARIAIADRPGRSRGLAQSRRGLRLGKRLRPPLPLSQLRS
jgi:hypothetical protein